MVMIKDDGSGDVYDDGDDKDLWKWSNLTSKCSKNENPWKIFLKSRDKKYWKIPSRKIPGLKFFIGSDNNKNSLSSVLMLELDSIAVPVFAVWLNLTNTIYSIRMNMRRGALSIFEHTLASCHQYIHRQQQHCHFSEKNPG